MWTDRCHEYYHAVYVPTRDSYVVYLTVTSTDQQMAKSCSKIVKFKRNEL